MAVVLFRKELSAEDELADCQKGVPTFTSRCDIPHGSLVFGRYSVLPWYGELERDLEKRGSRLVNSFTQHRWIADFWDWGGPDGVLSDLTFRSWRDWSDLPTGSFVVKGATNSRKGEWNTRMFCAAKEDVPRVAMSLYDDTLIRDQGVVIRQFVSLENLGTGLNGLPISHEWRTFWYKDDLLASGFYWSSMADSPLEEIPEGALEIAKGAAKRVCNFVNFFVIDVAKTKDGKWMVVEVNDGQMSGLCGCDAKALYWRMRYF